MSDKLKQHRVKEPEGEQLPLPFPSSIPNFLIDECVPHFWDLKAELKRAGVNATVAPEAGLCGKKDNVVSKAARELCTSLITTNYRFNYDTLFKGEGVAEAPPNIVWIDGYPQDISTFVGALQEMANITNNTSSANIRWFMYYSCTGNFVIEGTQIPPLLILKILPHLSKAKWGLANVDLRTIWGCSRSTAYRRARQLVWEEWLHKVGKTRGRRYFKGPKLRNLAYLGYKLRSKED